MRLPPICQRYPVILAVIAQVCGAFIVGQVATPDLPALWLGLHGAIAAAITVALGGSRWWIPFQMLIPFAIQAGLAWNLPGWVWLVCLVVIVLFYGGGVVTRVPLYLSNQAACQALVELLGDRPSPRAVDLGAGFGGPMRHLAQTLPGGFFVSVEASPMTCLGAWLLARGFPRRLRVRWADLWSEHLGVYDLVYVFLSPEPMPRIWAKVQAEMRPGTLLVSNTFPVPGEIPERVIDLPGRADARLYVYRR